jgi:hypothetical protein
LQFSFKVPEEITTPVSSNHPRYGARGGGQNPNFLNGSLLEGIFLEPLGRIFHEHDLIR